MNYTQIMSKRERSWLSEKPMGIVKLTAVMMCLFGLHANAEEMALKNEYPKSIEASNKMLVDIRGRVVDEAGQPISGVSVKIKGTSLVTQTNENGTFSIQNAGSGTVVLEFVFIGYNREEVRTDGSAPVNIRLTRSTLELTDVVVTALGISRQKRSLSYAVSDIKGEDIVHAGSSNLGTSLMGKLAGVDVSNMSGGPMTGTRINIRGINSLDGSARPLIVLDGIPVNDNDDGFTGRGAGGTANGSLLNTINPEDIASLTVLRGANAAALYGSQAINGAIVITTKKGVVNKGIGISFNSSYTVDQITGLPEYQNEYGNGTTPYFTTFAADGVTPTYVSTSTQNFGPKLEGQTVQWWDGVARPWVAQPNNFRDIFNEGYTNSNTLGISGANEKGNFRLSATNFNYGGFLPNMKQKRNSISFASGYNFTDKLTVDAQIIYNSINNQNPAQRIDRASNYPIPRNEIISLYEDNYKNSLGYYLTDEISTISGNFRDNILRPLFWDQRENRYTSDQQQFLASITGTYKVSDLLSFRIRGGTDRYFNLNETKERWLAFSNPTDASSLQGNYSRVIGQSFRNYGEFLALFTKDINPDFKLGVNLGASIDDSYGYSNNLATRGLRFNDVFSFNNSKSTVGLPKPSGSSGGERYDALFGSASLSFRDYLYLDVTARNDWSSKLPSYSRSYFYPSVGLSLILSDVVKMPAFISYAKLRGSYAQVGNTVPSRYFANSSYAIGSYLQGNGTSAVTSSIPASVPPTSIKAEKNYSNEYGLELSFLKNRINLDVTYYNNRGVDLIASTSVAPSSGASNLRINSGSLANKGLEVSLSADAVRSDEFRWRISANTSIVKRKVISLSEGIEERILGNPFNTVFKAVVGDSPYDIYMYKLARNEDGKLIVDANGNVTFESELSKVGNALPKMYGGLFNTFSYKGFDLQVSMNYRLGGNIVSYTNQFMKSSGVSKETLFGRDAEHGGIAFYTQGGKNIILKNGETPPTGVIVRNDGILVDGVKADGTPNENVIAANVYYGNRYGGFSTEDAVYKNNYLYLGELSLNYNVPNKFVANAGFTDLKIGLIGRNLFYIYKSLPNVSPNSAIGTGGTNAGYEYTAYPTARNIGFSVTAKF
ncbi:MULTISPECIES: SusC/RagA family TonB-linked outer membrane protein [Sphingobacterium]|uniref:SusC/RagA family TonB-linked outer membrane protein n=1 Tax=Sphingobacterium TaxID=28453 RepID=UPI0013DC397A|nr:MULTISPECIES: SusC/RagA family TonB-linked outer membrane protein [unclassified Sphingobacterium]